MATDRAVQERLAAHEAAQRLPAAEHLLWNEMTTNHRVPIYEGRIFVVWRAGVFGDPEPVDSLRVSGISATFARGIEIELLNARNKLVVVGQQPRQIAPHELFMWCPYSNDVQWLPHPKQPKSRHLRLALAMRMRSHPDYWKTGHTYITDVGAFRASYSQFANTKF